MRLIPWSVLIPTTQKDRFIKLQRELKAGLISVIQRAEIAQDLLHFPHRAIMTWYVMHMIRQETDVLAILLLKVGGRIVGHRAV